MVNSTSADLQSFIGSSVFEISLTMYNYRGSMVDWDMIPILMILHIVHAIHESWRYGHDEIHMSSS